MRVSGLLRQLTSCSDAWHAGREGLPRMRAALLEPFQLQDGVKADPGLYTAAVELLLAALAYHPSLVDVMLFPTALQGSQDTVRRSSMPLHAD